MTVQELIDELSKYPKDKKVYNDHIEENSVGVIVLTHEYTDEEKGKIDKAIKQVEEKLEDEIKHNSFMVTFVSRW